MQIILDRHFTNEQELKEFPCEFTSVPEYFTTKPPDERTAIVLMSHKFEHDLEALKYLFPHRPGYLAVLGPARRRMEMLDRIRKELPGLAREHENYLTTVKGPAGLNINARTPEEIGLSIVAQIVSIFNEASTK